MCEVGFCSVNVYSVGIVDSRVVLYDADNLSSIFFEEFRGPVSYGAEALNNYGLTSNTFFFYKRSFDERILIKQTPHAVVYTQAGRLGSAVYAALGDEFPCRTTFSIDVSLAVHVLVGIFNPCHSLLVGSEIRT